MFKVSILNTFLRGIAFFIDKIVYSFIPKLYSLIVSLANVNLYEDNSTIAILMNRVYILIGIFMLFRLSFSILAYIVDPSSFSDKTKGFTSLIKRVLIALVLLVSIPFLFGKMYEYQGKILNSGIIPRLILGSSASTGNSLESDATGLQFLVFGAFYTINYNSDEFAACNPETSNRSLANVIGTTDMALAKDGECLTKFSDFIKGDANVGDFFPTSEKDDRDFSNLSDLLDLTTKNGEYAINYTPIVSTLCGGYLVFLLLSFCIDVAARIIKLMFLQILSPVAVISSIDPTSSDDRLKEWGKECLTTFLSVFLRLAVIYLLIQMVRVITGSLFSGNLYYEGFTDSNRVSNIWIYIFLVFGAFSVAKKIPDLIEKALGIKLSGELNLNPFKALGENTAFQVGTGVALGGAVGAVSGAFGGALTAHGLGKNVIGGALGGLASGAVRGQYGGLRSANIGKSFNNAIKAGGRVSKAQQVRAETGGWAGLPAMLIDRALYEMGAPTTFQAQDSRVQRYKNIDNSMKEVEEAADAEMRKTWNNAEEARAFRAQEEEMMRAETAFRTTGAATVDVVQSIESQEEIDRYMEEMERSINDDQEAFNQAVSSGRLTINDEEYSRIRADLDARRQQFERAQEERRTTGKISVISSKTIKTAEEMDAYREQANQRKNALRASYIDKITNEEDKDNYNAEIASKRRAVDKAVRDTNLYRDHKTEGVSWREIADPSGKDSAGNKTVRKLSKENAADIEFSSGYDDSRDRDKALHDTAQRAHINDKN